MKTCTYCQQGLFKIVLPKTGKIVWVDHEGRINCEAHRG